MLKRAKKLGLASALTIITFVAANSVNAAIVTTATLPTEAVLNPVASSTTGNVYENVTGSENFRRSPWQGTNSTVDYTADNAWYSSVSGGATATYNFANQQDSVSFVWGSPDTYNDLNIELIAGGNVLSINGSEMFPPGTQGEDSAFVVISDVIFDQLIFSSGTTNAFEYANLTTSEVPLPAAAWLFISALGGLVVAKRKQRKV